MYSRVCSHVFPSVHGWWGGLFSDAFKWSLASPIQRGFKHVSMPIQGPSPGGPPSRPPNTQPGQSRSLGGIARRDPRGSPGEIPPGGGPLGKSPMVSPKGPRRIPRGPPRDHPRGSLPGSPQKTPQPPRGSSQWIRSGGHSRNSPRDPKNNEKCSFRAKLKSSKTNTFGYQN